METFHMPLREIEEKFTKSELVLMGWRSQEQSQSFKKRLHPDQSTLSASGNKRNEYYDGIGPERMPDEFFAQTELRDKQGRLIANAGDFNLGQVKGEQARQYFERVLRIPMPPNVITKIGADDPTTREIKEAYKIRS